MNCIDEFFSHFSITGTHLGTHWVGFQSVEKWPKMAKKGKAKDPW